MDKDSNQESKRGDDVLNYKNWQKDFQIGPAKSE